MSSWQRLPSLQSEIPKWFKTIKIFLTNQNVITWCFMATQTPSTFFVSKSCTVYSMNGDLFLSRIKEQSQKEEQARLKSKSQSQGLNLKMNTKVAFNTPTHLHSTLFDQFQTQQKVVTQFTTKSNNFFKISKNLHNHNKLKLH